jgi:release factor H-coupled RctB family protein
MGNSPLKTPVCNEAAQVVKFYNRETWIEGRAEDQLNQVASWKGVSAVAGFPDLHPGRFGPVGGAFLADRLYPQLVGPDIGCGMALYRLDLPKRKLKIDKAARRLRVLEDGADHNAAQETLEEAGLADRMSSHGLATVGSGNHFLELQVVKDILHPQKAQALGLGLDTLCLLVHSGSRSHGAGIFTRIEDSWAEGFAPESEEGQSYLSLHSDACLWARLNRRMVAEVAANALRSDLDLICDSVHNHLELHEGLWLHRKGAARPDQGLAPLAGSRETLSYLLSCEAPPKEALNSLSHGAGRRYDRSAMHGRIAKTKSGIAAMEQTAFGGRVICEDPALLIEEAGQAYKNAALVAADLEHFDVAHRVASLAPLITFKTTRRPGDRS